MKKVLILLLIILLPSLSLSAVPSTMTYQGKLADSGGTPINSTVSIVFTVYDASTGGSPLWTETQGSVTVTNGIFTVSLGSAVPLSESVFSTSADSWIGIKVGADSEMTPRLKFASVPFAQVAAVADNASNADNIGGLSCSTDEIAKWNGSQWVCDSAVSISVPTGYVILGNSITPPSGYTYTGRSIENGWSIKNFFDVTINFEQIATVNGKIYSFASDGTTLEYDLSTNIFTTKSPVPTVRGQFGLAVSGGKIYVLGGSSGSTLYNVNEEYAPSSDTWATKAPMPTARRVLTAASVNGSVFAMGGLDDPFTGTTLTVNEEYNPSTDSWATRAPIPFTELSANLFPDETGRRLYIMTDNSSGVTPLNYEYNPSEDLWVAKRGYFGGLYSPLPSQVVLNGKIYIFGTGFTSYEYDINTDSWSWFKPAIDGVYYIIVEGKLYNLNSQAISEYDSTEYYLHSKD